MVPCPASQSVIGKISAFWWANQRGRRCRAVPADLDQPRRGANILCPPSQKQPCQPSTKPRPPVRSIASTLAGSRPSPTLAICPPLYCTVTHTRTIRPTLESRRLFPDSTWPSGYRDDEQRGVSDHSDPCSYGIHAGPWWPLSALCRPPSIRHRQDEDRRRTLVRLHLCRAARLRRLRRRRPRVFRRSFGLCLRPAALVRICPGPPLRLVSAARFRSLRRFFAHQATAGLQADCV